MPIIFARRKQLCTCAHKLWKGRIGFRNVLIWQDGMIVCFQSSPSQLALDGEDFCL